MKCGNCEYSAKQLVLQQKVEKMLLLGCLQEKIQIDKDV